MLYSDYHWLLSRPRSTVVMVTSLSYGKNRNFDPCKIRTLKQIVTKIVKIDDVKERNVFLECLFNFGEMRPQDLLGKLVKYNFHVTFYVLIFSWTNV